MPDGSITGETDGPSGTANLAAALTAAGCGVSVVTDWSSYPHLEAALRFRAPQATLIRLPEQNTDNFIRTFIRDAKPTHLISWSAQVKLKTDIIIACAVNSSTT